jgi:hypothetical protein
LWVEVRLVIDKGGRSEILKDDENHVGDPESGRIFWSSKPLKIACRQVDPMMCMISRPRWWWQNRWREQLKEQWMERREERHEQKGKTASTGSTEAPKF